MHLRLDAFLIIHMDFLFDPSLWVGLLTLVVLEIVLGIDNLVFVAILAKKLPLHQQNRAVYVGLGLALFMRLALLSIMSWLVSLTAPLFSVLSHAFSARDLILMAGGIFLLYKATTELHERLEAKPHAEGMEKTGNAKFWFVIAQILLLDAVFSLDSIITAVGMVDNLGVMMTAVIAAMVVMVLASRPLTAFVNRHPTVVVLCLSFLLMIGLSLVAEGLGFHIPKGYLYAAIGFSILIEFFNQIASRNSAKHQARIPFRERTTMAIVGLLEKRPAEAPKTMAEEMAPAEPQAFGADERDMVEGVLSLADRSIRVIMTPRAEIGWLNLKKPFEEIVRDAQSLRHSIFPVGDGSLDNLVGFVKAKDFIGLCGDVETLRALATKRHPFMVPETVSIIRLVRDIKKSRAPLVLVTDEFGIIQGLVTSHDILEAIAGDFPDEGDRRLIQPDPKNPQAWLAEGAADLLTVRQALDDDLLFEEKGDKDADYVTIAGFLLERFGRLPQPGEVVEERGWRLEASEVSRNRIAAVRIERCPDSDALEAESRDFERARAQAQAEARQGD